VLTAVLSAPTSAGAALAVAGLALLAVRHPFALMAAIAAMGIATGVGIHEGASPAAGRPGGA
jgi:hypothetical protein